MSELITNKETHYEVAEELLWVKNQIQKELTNLQQDIQEDQIKKSFYEKVGDNVEFDINLVKKYLASCLQNENFQVNSAVVMAVQIALESLDLEKYYLGKIDGLLTRNSGKMSKTQRAIRLFQKDNNIHVDGFPGKETITKILERLGSSSTLSQKTSKPKQNEIVEESTKAERISNSKEANIPQNREEAKKMNILTGELNAKNINELGGVGASTMYKLSKAGNFKNLQGDENASTEKKSWFKEEDGKYKMLSYGERLELGDFCRTKGIKSFMLCFEGNENWDTFQKNITELGDYVKKTGIQPVLCTCVGDAALKNKSDAGDNINDLIRSLGRSKGRPVIDFAKIDHNVILRNGKNINAEGYNRMAEKLEQLFPSAEK